MIPRRANSRIDPEKRIQNSPFILFEMGHSRNPARRTSIYESTTKIMAGAAIKKKNNWNLGIDKMGQTLC
jgi:hypothetical protein